MIREQFSAFAMVAGIGFLLLGSLIASAVFAALGKVVGGYFPAALFEGVNFVVSLFAITFLFALYLGKAGVGSAYGAAGSLIVLFVRVKCLNLEKQESKTGQPEPELIGGRK